MHPRDDVDRKEGGRGLASIEDSVDTLIRLKDLIEKRRGRLITVTRNSTNDTRISGTITRNKSGKKVNSMNPLSD